MAFALLAFVTLAYAGYNLFVKASGSHAPAEATTTILATLCLQAGAVTSALVFVAFLGVQGGHSFRLTAPAYGYALAAGLCIGAAEVGYFYLFGGIGGMRALPAGLVVPAVVAGTVVLALLASVIVFGERLSAAQLAGAAMILGGIAVMFWAREGGGA